MTLWMSLTILGVLAILFVAWPLYSSSRRFTPVIAISVLLVAGLSAALYGKTGSPNMESGSGDESLHAMDDTVALLAERLDANPDDLNGWKMLGRSYMSLGDYDGAVAAFENAVELESSKNAQTMVDLASALLASGGGGVTGRAAALFESALAIEPNNPQGLFYGGIAAINRGDQELAATRWEMLLALNPPVEIQGILEQRVAEWRGQPAPAEMPAALSPALPEQAAKPLEQVGSVVRANVSLSDAALAALPGDATVFIIARDPAQPSPPIAVVRRRLTELPAAVDLNDSNSMVPGRSLSGFPEFELIARVSLSGQPTQQPGDWFGAQIVRPAESNSISLPIDTEVR